MRLLGSLVPLYHGPTAKVEGTKPFSYVGISSLPSLLLCLHRKETEAQREVPWLSPSGTRGKHRFRGVSDSQSRSLESSEG